MASVMTEVVGDFLNLIFHRNAESFRLERTS